MTRRVIVRVWCVVCAAVGFGICDKRSALLWGAGKLVCGRAGGVYELFIGVGRKVSAQDSR